MDTGPATEESGMLVMKLVGILYLLIIIFDLIIVNGMDNMTNATAVFLFLFFFAILALLLAISRKPQNRQVSGPPFKQRADFVERVGTPFCS